MNVIDRKRILRLMAIQDISARQLADAAGWSSHTYLQRILRGEVTSGVSPEAATKIAGYLRVNLEDLFVPRASTDVPRQVVRRRAS